MSAVTEQKTPKVTLGKVKGSFDLIPVITIFAPILLALVVGLIVGIIAGSFTPVVVFGVLGAIAGIGLTVAYSLSVIEQ